MTHSSNSTDPTPPAPGGVVRSGDRPISFSIANPGEGKPRVGPDRVSPFPVQQSASQLPLLPRRKRPSFSSHRHDANPALALKVLQDIQIAVDAWHGELKQTIQQIQALYMEGPIVDGWLEVVDDPGAPAKNPHAAMLRHADPQDLSGYVDQIYQSLETAETHSPQPGIPANPTYRLCSLDSDGRLNCIPCPPEQLSTISLAIARHQRLRQLLDQKQYLEARLKRTVEVLTHSRDVLDITPACSSNPEAEV